VRILIAEDDAISRTILQRAVEKLGHECLTAEDGEAAWELYKSTSGIDVIISDWMMPGIDGLELCRRVRNEGHDGYTYFIFLTALGDRQHLFKGLEAGADDYLTKPLNRDELQVRLISASRVTSLHRRLAEQNARLELLNTRLFEQARKDPLTGLGNRLLLQEDLEALRSRAERYGHSYCAVLCDVDFFKQYNDTYGHLAGDEVLKQVAETMKGCFRRGDTAYRFGGEEFLIVLPEQTSKTATVAAERLRTAIQNLQMPHEKSPFGVVTISAGITALLPGIGKNVDDLLNEADAALYRAKRSGRNRVAAYEAASNGD
jgi:two-component system cell cycle response regulator